MIHGVVADSGLPLITYPYALALTNPGFEAGSTAGWTSRSGGTPGVGTGTPYAGTYKAIATPSGLTAKWDQQVTLPARALTAVDAGGLYIEARAYHTGFTDADAGGLYIEFFDAGSALISRVQRAHSDPGSWTQEAIAAQIPTGIRSVRIGTNNVRITGTELSAYWDDFELEISDTAYSDLAEAVDGDAQFLSRFETAAGYDEVTGQNAAFNGNAAVDGAEDCYLGDGTGDWATYPSVDSNMASSWTLEFYIKASSQSTKGIAGRAGSGAGRWVAYIDGSNIGMWINNYSTGAAMVTVANASALDGSWHHVAFVRDGGTWRAYLDGVESTSRVNSSAASSSSSVFHIGTDPFSTSGRSFDGRLDRVKITPLALYPSGTTFTPPARTDP